MKPISRPFLLTVIILSNIIFLLALTWWLWFTLSSFSLINKPVDDGTPPIEKLNTDDLNKIFPNLK